MKLLEYILCPLLDSGQLTGNESRERLAENPAGLQPGLTVRTLKPHITPILIHST